jgi:hypothetical protein
MEGPATSWVKIQFLPRALSDKWKILLFFAKKQIRLQFKVNEFELIHVLDGPEL